MRYTPLFASLSILALVAGCSDSGVTQPPAEPATQSSSQPAQQSSSQSATEAPAAANDDSGDVATAACLDAVMEETNETDVSVTSSDFSEAGTLVMLAVGPDAAPWRCLASNDGVVEEVGFAGTDGDGPTESEDSGPAALSQSDLESACLSATSSETNESDVVVLSSEFSEANTEIMVGVGPDQAPWRCLIWSDGTIAELSFTGSEGAL